MNLSGVMLGTEDSKKLGEFYTKLLGKPGWQQNDWYGWMIGTGNLMVGPHSEVNGKNNTPGRIMFTFDSDDVPADFKKLTSQGAVVVAEPYHPGQADETMWLATLADPDGNYFQLATPWKE